MAHSASAFFGLFVGNRGGQKPPAAKKDGVIKAFARFSHGYADVGMRLVRLVFRGFISSNCHDAGPLYRRFHDIFLLGDTRGWRFYRNSTFVVVPSLTKESFAGARD